MKREEALERLEFRVRHSCPQANGDNIGDCNICWRYPCNDMKALEVLKERPHGEWIPCSERLPKAGQVVIVSDVRGDVYEYTMNLLNVDKYIDDKWTFMGYEILAWMPLPEPYKEEGDENG